MTFQFFATTPKLQKILYTLELQQPYLIVETLTLRPLNAFRNFKPAAGQDPEVNVQMDVVAYSFPAPDKPAVKITENAPEKATAQATAQAIAQAAGNTAATVPEKAGTISGSAAATVPEKGAAIAGSAAVNGAPRS